MDISEHILTLKVSRQAKEIARKISELRMLIEDLEIHAETIKDIIEKPENYAENTYKGEGYPARRVANSKGGV